MSRRSLKLVVIAGALGSIALAAAAGAMVPRAIVPGAIVAGMGLGWAAGLAIGRMSGSASGSSLWAWSTALGAAVATTGLIPHASVAFLGSALLVAAAAVLSAKAIVDSIESRRDQH